MAPRPGPWTSRFGPRTVGLVALGGAVGTAARYELTQLLPASGFPLVTLLVNVAGAFLLGLLVQLLGRLAATRPVPAAALRLLLATGVLGGFTTYSALALDTVTFPSLGSAVLYSGGTLVLGMAAAYAGVSIGGRP